MGFWGWFILFVVGFIAIVGMSEIKLDKKKREMNAKLRSYSNFSPSQTIVGENGKTGFAMDEERKQVALISVETPELVVRIFNYEDVLSSEIFVDDNTISRTSRTSQVGGALVGGLLFGGLGAVVGGLSGKSISSKKVEKIDLRITVNDTKNPLHDVNFLRFASGESKSAYIKAVGEARHWHGLVAIIIKSVDV